MAGLVAVVTDSSASVAPAWAGASTLTIVPLRLLAGDAVADDLAGPPPAAIAAELRRGARLTTAGPPPERLAAAYAAAAAAGAPGVVSVHLSGALSGTADAARLAAAGTPLPVRVIDSRSIGAGLGLVVRSALAAAAAGADADEVAAAAERAAAGVASYFALDSSVSLRAGGRLSEPAPGPPASAPGPPGPAGSLGVAGSLVSSGAAGLSGAARPLESSGMAGASSVAEAGASGVAGAAGTSGAAEAGASGVAGAAGTSGAAEAGASGVTGAAGTSEVAGASGVTGVARAAPWPGSVAPYESRASAGETSARLRSRPLLHIAGGQVEILERVRTRAAARDRLTELAADAFARLGRSALANAVVQYTGAPDEAVRLRDQLAVVLPLASPITVLTAGLAIQAHAGPGLLAVAVAPAGP